MRSRLKNKPQYFVDVETTGLSNDDAIIEYCIIKVEHGIAKSIHGKVKPPKGVRVHPKAASVNGYTPEKWKNAMTQKQAYENIKRFCEKSGVWIAHNVQFDIGFLRRLFIKFGDDLRARRSIDTYTLAYEHLVPLGLESLGFDEIRKFLGWEVHQHHSAIQDTWDVYKLWRRISKMGTLRRWYTILTSRKYRRSL